jgi:hypothetical protein
MPVPGGGADSKRLTLERPEGQPATAGIR